MDIKEAIDEVNIKITSFFTFIASRLQNFKNISLGEQISYPAVGLGLLILIISLFMFIL